MTRSSSEPAPSLTIRLFGGFEMLCDGQPLQPVRSRKEQWLFALLALRHPHPVERDWLAAALWPDSTEEQAADYLRHSLSTLRRVLGACAGCITAPGPRTVGLDLCCVRVDLFDFDAACDSSAPEDLRAAAALYRGPLLPACDELWVAPERHARELRYCETLENLAKHAAQTGDLPTAITWLRQLVCADPLRERAVCDLMKCLAEQGEHVAVTQIYRGFRSLLREELNSEPHAETVALYAALRGAATPAARSGDRGAEERREITRLPRSITPLVGRAAELERCAAALRACRLLTITGAPGVGKSRLTSALAEDAAPRYDEGACVADMAHVAASAEIDAAVVGLLGIAMTSSEPPIARLVSYLRCRHTRLVLDNCEHVAQECALLVAQLLRCSPRLTVLCASRRPLRLPGEQICRLAPLSQATLSEADPVEALTAEAVQLFVERAAASCPGFALASHNVRSVIALCHLLDGLPLALEMAAQLIRTIPLGEMVARLQLRLELLHGDRTGAEPRHGSLQAAFDASYGLLAREEQRALRALATLQDGWNLETAEALLLRPGEPPDSVLMLLSRLVDSALVEYEPHYGDGRYRLLNTIRRFALDKPDDYPEGAVAVTRCAPALASSRIACGLTASRAGAQLRGTDATVVGTPNAQPWDFAAEIGR